jgi:hypothetical protein
MNESINREKPICFGGPHISFLMHHSNEERTIGFGDMIFIPEKYHPSVFPETVVTALKHRFLMEALAWAYYYFDGPVDELALVVLENSPSFITKEQYLINRDGKSFPAIFISPWGCD